MPFDKLEKDQFDGQPLKVYGSQAAMFADQAKQREGYFYNDGTKDYVYLGTTNGNITDYREFGGGAGGGLELIPFSTVINMTGNFKSVHVQTGALAMTKGSFPTPASNFENKTVQLITANGTGGKPTFSADFVLQMDTWSNNTGDINQLIYKGSPSGKILVWMDNVELA